MTANADPWRTLGLTPGASAEDVRAAYRRLAKANHPDAAGEGALPRFLAIQAAYEQIVGGGRRRPGARPGSGPGREDREPWRADPDRARASGRADRRRPGARPASGRPASADTDDGGPPRPPGTTRDGRGQARAGPSAAGPRGSREPGGPGQTAEPNAERARNRRTSGRRRAPNKATPYSTSYDAADDEPFEPGWSGATWYGASSGTYWTINPKEYADPRKHGPEYQRRARRPSDGRVLDDGVESADGVDARTEPEDERRDIFDHAQDRPTGASAAPAGAAAGASPQGRPAAPTWTDARAGAPPTWRDAHAPGTAEGPALNGRPPVEPPRPDGVIRREAGRGGSFPLLPRPATLVGRIATALLGWPPLGLAIAAGIGEETGCGRFAASCNELSSPGTWIVQAAILLLFLALPTVAWWSAHGTVAAFAIGVPVTIVLTAGGASRQPEASAATLGAVLAIAYAIGVGYSILAPLRPRAPDRVGP